MKKIRMKKAARDQLPQLESNGAVELRYSKMANRPEREASQEALAGYRFQNENGNVYADQQSRESRHKTILTVRAYFRTKVTNHHNGHDTRDIWFTTTTQS
jgi:hypothetical protein